jgi:hypothetical protein
LETPRNPSQFLVKTLVEKVFEKKGYSRSVNNCYTTTLTMTLTTTTTNLAVTTRTTTMTRTKTTKATMNNSKVFFLNIILIICTRSESMEIPWCEPITSYG